MLRLILLAAALGGPALAQVPPPNPRQADVILLTAWADAFNTVRQLYIDPVPPKTLVVRALHGLATAPALTSPDQKRLIAAASDTMAKAGPDDVMPLLRGFGDLVDALRATAGAPAMDAMLRAATAGMLDGLDTQTRFMPPSPPATPAGAAGVGLGLMASPDGPRVTRAYVHDPAANAGVWPGDGLVSIDGHSTKDLPLTEVMTLLRGPAGSRTTLLIRRAGTSAPITFELTRTVIRIPLVSARAIGPVAYLRLESFAPGAAKVLHQAFTELQSRAASPISGVVLDLRGNQGGRLTEAVAAADEFLPPASLIATTVGREASDHGRFTAAAGDMTAGLPMVVLVNEATGAGSEIVAAALQAGRGAVVMGSHTAGAGLVGTVRPIPPLGAMTFTTQRIILPSGEPLKPPGVLPQVALTPTPGSSIIEAPGRDPMIVRLRRGIPQSPQAGEPFDDPDAPASDFEVRQACAALAMLSPGQPSHP